MVKNNLTLPNAGSVLNRFSMRYCGFCRFVARYCGFGYPPMPPPHSWLTTFLAHCIMSVCTHKTEKPHCSLSLLVMPYFYPQVHSFTLIFLTGWGTRKDCTISWNVSGIYTCKLLAGPHKHLLPFISTCFTK